MSVEEATWPAPTRTKLSRRRLVLAVLVGAVAAAAGLGLVPPTSSALGPAQVTATGKIGTGRTVLTVPPLGDVSASTHATPIQLDLVFRTIDFEKLGPLATTAAGRDELQLNLRDDLEQLVRGAAVRMLLGALAVGAIVVALVFDRRWQLMTAGALGGAVAVAVLLGTTAASFDTAAFEEPSYSGTLARAPVVIEAVRTNAGVLDDLRTRYETAARRLSGLLVLVARPDVDPRTDSTQILHIGDVHANPLGLEIAEELAREFQVDGVIDTGDLASSSLDTGSLSSLAGPIDRRMATAVEGFGVPYVFVPGNHDSPGLIDELRRANNVTILEGTSAEIDGISILGWDDPTFTTDSSVTQNEKDERRLAQADEVAAAVEDTEPDVLAVHDERLASASKGLVPLILAGHQHERGLELDAGTTLLTVGSTGATGLKSLTLEAEKDYEAEVIYFRSGVAVAVDYVTFRGSSNDFEVQRTTLDEAPGGA